MTPPDVSPMMPNNPQPVLYLVPTSLTKKDESQSIPLFLGTWTVGRNGETDISLPKDTVSRIHAKLIVEATSITVVDLGSSNGITVGSEKIMEKKVRPGEEIQFGDFPMRLSTTPIIPVGPNIKTNPIPRRSLVPPIHPLWPAQNRVFLLLIHKDAFSEKEIAAKLHITHHTVHNHVKSIYEAYEVNSRTELVMKALGTGYDGGGRE